MTLVKYKALRAFTEFVSNFGMVHGDPEGSDERARFPSVPEDSALKLIAEGKIEALDGEVLLPQLDHDGDGAPGGSVSATGDDLKALRALYRDALGKAPFNGWNADELRRRIDESSTGTVGAPI